jgi:DNA mismatch repair protein MLH1
MKMMKHDDDDDDDDNDNEMTGDTASPTTTTNGPTIRNRPQQQRLQPPPPKIQVLSRDVVEQIAAGEIVQRTSLAVKELLENSVDANSTMIRISISFATTGSATRNTTAGNSSSNQIVGGGGCFSFIVTDNGTGISHVDLPLACTRHATSKITSHLDLTSTETTRATMTFGFRGEALAAMSMVARNITITSRTTDTASSTNRQWPHNVPVPYND